MAKTSSVQILTKAYSSAECPDVNYMLIRINQETAKKLMKLHLFATLLGASELTFIRMEFADLSCVTLESLPSTMAEHEDALDKTNIVILELDKEQRQGLRKAKKSLELDRVAQVETHRDIPSLNGFRWRTSAVQSEMIPLRLVERIANGEHIFTTTYTGD